MTVVAGAPVAVMDAPVLPRSACPVFAPRFESVPPPLTPNGAVEAGGVGADDLAHASRAMTRALQAAGSTS